MNTWKITSLYDVGKNVMLMTNKINITGKV